MIHKITFLIVLCCCSFSIKAQILTSGNYKSNDLGYAYTVVVEQEGNVITITEPNKVNEYKSSGGNTYYHTEPKYAHFYIKVASNTSYYAGKQGGSQQLFNYSGENTNENEVLLSGIDDCPLYDKYLNLTQSDDIDAQSWAFCGAAALAKCTYSELDSYLETIIKSMKSIMENPSKCPCEDVISKTQWNSVSID